MSFGGRFGVVLCRFRVGSFRPRKSQPYSPPCFTNFHPQKNFFSRQIPQTPIRLHSEIGHQKSKVPCLPIFNVHFSILNFQSSLPSPRISQNFPSAQILSSFGSKILPCPKCPTPRLASLHSLLITHHSSLITPNLPNPTQSNRTILPGHTQRGPSAPPAQGGQW